MKPDEGSGAHTRRMLEIALAPNCQLMSVTAQVLSIKARECRCAAQQGPLRQVATAGFRGPSAFPLHTLNCDLIEREGPMLWDLHLRCVRHQT